MKFEYLVLHNGVYYKPGEEVPIGKETKEETKVETTEVAEDKVEPKSQPGRKKKSE